MNNTNNLFVLLFDKLNLLAKACIPALTIAVSGFTLFLLGFHVIPVFADKTPQIFPERTIQSELITQMPTSATEETGTGEQSMVPAEKKTLLR